MNDETKKPRLPEIGEWVKMQGTLVRIDIVPPPSQPPPETVYIFEREDARIDLLLKGKVLKQLVEYNEFYGQGTAVKSCIEEAKEFCRVNNIGPDSDIEVVVMRETDLIGRKVDEGKQPTCYAPGIVPFKNETFYAHGSRREEVVWTSRNPTEESQTK
jgi:hypothetical protein